MLQLVTTRHQRHGSCKFTCWFSGRFSEAFGGLSCVRLLSGEKTPLCKNICCGNGCQSPFCGLRLFFAQILSFVFIIYVGEGTVVTILKMLLKLSAGGSAALSTFFLYYFSQLELGSACRKVFFQCQSNCYLLWVIKENFLKDLEAYIFFALVPLTSCLEMIGKKKKNSSIIHHDEMIVIK